MDRWARRYAPRSTLPSPLARRTSLRRQRMRLKPRDHFLRVRVGRKHRIEDVLDPAVARDECQALQQRHALEGERRQTKCASEGQVFIAQDFKRNIEPLDHLLLIRRVLGAQAEHLSVEASKVFVMIAKAARFGRAAASPGNV